jgi:peptidylprolyl isomerase
MSATRLTSAALFASVALGLAGCGNSSTSEPAKPTEPARQSEPAKPIPVQSGAEALKRPKATVSIPDKPLPKKLVVWDLIEGSGPVAKKGDELTLRYVGRYYESGKFWSWNHGKRFTVHLGAGEVLLGWDEGLLGMRVGGRRKLIVPPRYVWPRGAAPPNAGPEDALIYVVDLLEIG